MPGDCANLWLLPLDGCPADRVTSFEDSANPRSTSPSPATARRSRWCAGRGCATPSSSRGSALDASASDQRAKERRRNRHFVLKTTLMRWLSRRTVIVHLRRDLQLAEEPHHGRHPVQGLAVHVQDHVATAESEPFGRPGRLHLRDRESIDHPLTALDLAVPRDRERRTQEFGQVCDGGLDRLKRRSVWRRPLSAPLLASWGGTDQGGRPEPGHRAARPFQEASSSTSARCPTSPSRQPRTITPASTACSSWDAPVSSSITTAAAGVTSGPAGWIAAHDVVLLKVNAQWKYRGCTNSDVVRGLIQRILGTPDGFTGEVVLVENGQGRGSLNCDTSSSYGGDTSVRANANDEAQGRLRLPGGTGLPGQPGVGDIARPDPGRPSTSAPTTT